MNLESSIPKFTKTEPSGGDKASFRAGYYFSTQREYERNKLLPKINP